MTAGNEFFDLFIPTHYGARPYAETEWDPTVDLITAINSHRPAWHTQANCHGHTDLMYATDRGPKNKAAIALCDACPVREVCLEDATENDEKYGVRGGMSERGRRPLIVARNKERRAAAA